MGFLRKQIYKNWGRKGTEKGKVRSERKENKITGKETNERREEVRKSEEEARKNRRMEVETGYCG